MDQTTSYIALFVVCVGSFLSPLCLASVSVAIPSLASDLKADAVLVSWIPTVFLLSNVAFMLAFGKLADNFGRKRVYACGLFINAAASLGAYYSNSIEWILLFRGVQGIGSAMSFGTGMAIITSVFPAKDRGLPLGLNAASVYFGLTVAPALGGLITETFGWRAVFLIPIPLAVLLLVIIACFLKTDWRKDQYSPFDWIGTLLFASWALTLVFGLTGLPDLPNVLLLLLAIALFVLFIWHQANHDEPLIRVQLFKESRVFSFSLATASLMYASTYPLAFLLSLYLQYVRGLSPLETGQVLLVRAIAMALLAPFAGKLSDRIEPRLISTLGCFIVGFGFVLLAQLNSHTDPYYISVSLFLIGIGFGFFSAPNQNAILSSVDHNEIGVASATLNLARICGNLVGISLVNLLVKLWLGDAQITPEIYDLLLSTVKLSLTISLGFVVCAGVFSATRGRVQPILIADKH